MAIIDPTADIVTLTRDICNIPSVSENEEELCDAVEQCLQQLDHLTVEREHNTVVARTQWGHSQRVILAGHLDTVPLTAEPNLPCQLVGDELWGRGTVDMKGGLAVMLRAAQEVRSTGVDLTYLFYECEEIEATKNGLGLVSRTHPEWLHGDVAVLLEPTSGAIEGGCKGTLRVVLRAVGVAAHSARPWMGANAIHRLAGPLEALSRYTPRDVVVDGLTYHEGFQAVGVTGGAATNVVPDQATLTVNYRFAPDRSAQDAVAHVEDFFRPWLEEGSLTMDVVDLAGGALPGLSHPAIRALVDAVQQPVRAKEGWTDVARFSELGVPAINWGPGDPLLAHRDDERVPLSQLRECERGVLEWLGGRSPQ